MLVSVFCALLLPVAEPQPPAQPLSATEPLSSTEPPSAAEPQSNLDVSLSICEGHCGVNDWLCKCDAACMYYKDCCEGFREVCPAEVRKGRRLMASNGVPDNKLCEADAVTLEVLFLDTSCENRCGTEKTTEDLEFYPARPLKQYRNCSCDTHCGYHGDCCLDFSEFCPDEYQYFQDISELYPVNHDPDRFSCVAIADKILVVNTCPDGSRCKFTLSFNEDANTFVPMYDRNRRIHYINGQCAVCNGAIDVVPWNVELTCKNGDLTGVPENYTSGKINSTDAFQTFSLPDYRCRLTYTNPGEEQPCISSHYIESTCPQTCENLDLVSKCESEAQDVVNSNYHFYKNVYCAVCNAGRWNIPPGKMSVVSDFSLTLVFDFNPRRGLTVGRHQIPECATGETYVRNEDACRLITCLSGFVLDGSDCIPEPSNITVIVSGFVSRDPTPAQLLNLEDEIGTLEKSITDSFELIAEKYNISQHGISATVALEYTNSTVIIQTVIQCNCDYSTIAMEDGGTLGNSFSDAIEEEVRNAAVEYLMEINLKLSTVQASITLQLNQTISFNKTLSECIWLVYQPQEIQRENNTVTVIATERTYPFGLFHVLEQFVIVCETDLDLDLTDGDVDSDIENILGLITIICLSISIICLLIRVALQFFISSFRNKPGKLQFNLTLAFLFAFILVLVGPLLDDIPDACTTVAILLAYGFLAAFTWMNVIAVDTWMAFRPSAAFAKSSANDSSIFWHILPGWGISLIFVIISIVLNYVDVDERYDPQFGGVRCFYTQRYAMLICFGIPIALSIFVNLILYVITSLNLRKALENSAKLGNARNDFRVYVRLFILMGITWIFGFISAFIDDDVIDFIHVILNSLQGLFLFVSFVCNKTVLSEIRQKVVKETSSSKATSSSPLSNNKTPSSSTV